jgi:parallel beta-helix repeat protein
MTTLIPKFQQSNTGAVNRAINLKLAESVSVLDFGAVADGVVGSPAAGTDNTTAFQNALNTGHNVFVPAGVYKINALTMNFDGQVLTGEGSTTDVTLAQNEGTILVNMSASNTMLTLSANANKVEGITFIPNYPAASTTSITPIGIKAGSYSLITHCSTIGSFAAGFYLAGCSRPTVWKCQVWANGTAQAGIWLDGGPGVGGGGYTVSDCMLYGTPTMIGEGLIYITNVPDFQITGNYIAGGDRPGIRAISDFPPASYVNNYGVISNNDIDTIYNWGIYLDGQYQVHINNNWISCGRRLDGATVRANATGSIWLDNVTMFYINNNDCYAAQGEFGGATPIVPPQPSTAIRIDSGVGGVIDGNTVQNHTNGILLTDSIRINVVNNLEGNYSGLSPEGTSMQVANKQAGTCNNNSFVNNNIYQLNPPGNGYTDITTFTPPSVNFVNSWTNVDYDTFTSTGANVTSAINIVADGKADSTLYTVYANSWYKVTIVLDLNSGTAPTAFIYNGSSGAPAIITSQLLVNGVNTIIYQETVGGASGHVLLSNTSATNYSLNINVNETSF